MLAIKAWSGQNICANGCPGWHRCDPSSRGNYEHENEDRSLKGSLSVKIYCNGPHLMNCPGAAEGNGRAAEAVQQR